MKFAGRTLCLITSLYTLSIYAGGLEDHVHFDQSQDVYFEQFDANLFSLELLQAKDKFQNHDVIVGGSFQVDAQHWNGDRIEASYQKGTDLYFTQATLDLMTKVNSWATLFGSAAEAYIGNMGPAGNTFFSPHAFALFGNLNQFPVYLTTGINDIPFGVFTGTGPWDTPLTANYFNPSQAPQISLAFYKKGWNIAATEFNDQTNYKNHMAYSLYYKKTIEKFGYTAGIGYATALQANANNNAVARAQHVKRRSISNTEKLGDVLDLNGSVTYNNLTLLGEYDRGTQNVLANRDRPSAYSLVINYIKNLWGRDTTFGAGYSETFHLKDVPTGLQGNNGLSSAPSGLKNAWSLNVSRAIFSDNVELGADWQRATTYPTATHSNGKNSNTYTLDLVVYL